MLKLKKKLQNWLDNERRKRFVKRAMEKYIVYIGSGAAIAKAKKQFGDKKYIVLQPVSYLRSTEIVLVDDKSLKYNILKQNRII